MEPRKIVVMSTKTQKKSVIMSAATTLGELKADLRANNIDYTDMDFYEGTARVQLKADDSVLPHDVPYKGNTTNELVFMLTTANKKIRSGALTRAEAYAKVKELGIQDEIKKKYGKNFTQCSTTDLISMIDKYSNKAKPVKKSEEKQEKKAENIVQEMTEETPQDVNPVEEIAKQIIGEDNKDFQGLVDLIADLTTRVENLEKRVKTLEDSECSCCGYDDEEEEEDDSPYSEEDIDEMFDFMND